MSYCMCYRRHALVGCAYYLKVVTAFVGNVWSRPW